MLACVLVSAPQPAGPPFSSPELVDLGSYCFSCFVASFLYVAGFESAAVAVYLSASFSWTGDSRQLVCSLRCGVLLSLGDLADDARVAGQGSLGLVERVGVRGHELSPVVGAAVTDNDLGAVLVGHDYGRAGQSASVRIRMIWL